MGEYKWVNDSRCNKEPVSLHTERALAQYKKWLKRKQKK